MNLQKRQARRLREKYEELETLRREINRIKSTAALSLATQYAIDFACPGESVIMREELEHDITEDIGALEAEDGQASALIAEAIEAGELQAYGDDRLIIPTRTWMLAGYYGSGEE